MASHGYELELTWDGNLGTGTSAYATYSREFRVSIAGKAELVGSADPTFRGDPGLMNPEEMLVASLSSCHLLSYLALCARAGIRVESYRDRATGRMVGDKDGGKFEEVILAPHVGVAPGTDLAKATAIHDDAHAACYIARSCNFAVRHVPEVIHVDHAPTAPTRRDLAVRLPDRPGALADFGELVGRSGVSLEGGGGFVTDGSSGGATVHFLVADDTRAIACLREAGFDVIGSRDVVTTRLDQTKPGQLGALSRQLADAGVNIEVIYTDHDHRLVLVVDKLAEAGAVIAAYDKARTARRH